VTAMPCILTINAGSSSLKLAVFEAATLARIRTVHVDDIAPDELDASLAAAIAKLEAELGEVTWAAVGHRVVNGGQLGPRIVDAALVRTLAELVPLAPLHQPHNLAGIEAARRRFPAAVHVACFDTTFHCSLPDVARAYALPRALTNEGIEVYGYHGLSYEYVASVLPEHLGDRADGRVIVAHLGSGASLCAMIHRKSIATTMGFTPLDGLPMATRCGAIDPGVVLYLIETRGMSAAAVRELLYERSGLLGVSGESGSMKVLLASPSRGAAEAIALFVHRTACAIGSLAVALGGLDALVFTGGIGEHSAEIRARIFHKIAWLGPPAIAAIATDEELAIARHVAAALR
jgi:acetate kinase